jgi:glycosyltransferase involved in cell wall biosynthesis
MRILWLITRYWPAVGGAETHARQIIHELAARGHEICVVSHWDENRTDWLRGTTITAPISARTYEDGHGVRVVRLGAGTWRRARTILPAATYYVRQRGAAEALAQGIAQDIFRECGTQWDIVHGVRVGREPLYIAGYHVARRLGVPFVFTPLHHPRWVGWRYRVYLDLYRRADALVALTQHEARLYESMGVARERIGVHGIGPVLPESADGMRFRTMHGIRGPLVLFLGQKYPYKGWEQMLKAAQEVWRQQPDATFAFLGPRTSASRKVFTTMRDKRVLELDAVDLQTKGDALAACDIFCLPSEQESFGGVYTEAWSYGKPVIGCDIPAVRDVIIDGVTGLLTRPGDVSDLALHINQLLTDSQLRDQLGDNGRHNVERLYSWPRIADDTERIYLRTLEATDASHGGA